MRQKELALEKCWVTSDGFFRIITTLFGITVVDAWRGYKRSLLTTHRHKNVPLLKFVDMMVLDLLTNEMKDEEIEDSISSFRSAPISTIVTEQEETQISQLTHSTQQSSTVQPLDTLLQAASIADHVMGKEVTLVKEGKERRLLRQRCSLCFGKKTKSKTSWFCKAPSCAAKAKGKHYWLCHQCFPLHVNEIKGEMRDSFENGRS